VFNSGPSRPPVRIRRQWHDTLHQFRARGGIRRNRVRLTSLYAINGWTHYNRVQSEILCRAHHFQTMSKRIPKPCRRCGSPDKVRLYCVPCGLIVKAEIRAKQAQAAKSQHAERMGSGDNLLSSFEIRTRDEVAKVLNLTRQRVAQIEHSALAKIRRGLLPFRQALYDSI
jgi:ribosomal protein L37E